MKDLVAISGLATLIMGLTLLPFTPDGVRSVLAPLLVLILPGYALVAALDRRRQAETVELLVLSLGGSIGLTILTGLALNLTPWGLQREAWALALGLLVLALSGIAALRRRQVEPDPNAVSLRDQLQTLGQTWAMRPIQLLQLGFALVLIASTLVVAQAGLQRNPDPGFTQLWMLELDQAEAQQVQLGITNHEWEATTYRLQLMADTQLLNEWPTIMLQPGATWQITATLALEPSQGTAIEAFLYRADDPLTVYRRTRLVLR